MNKVSNVEMLAELEKEEEIMKAVRQRHHWIDNLTYSEASQFMTGCCGETNEGKT